MYKLRDHPVACVTLSVTLIVGAILYYLSPAMLMMADASAAALTLKATLNHCAVLCVCACVLHVALELLTASASLDVGPGEEHTDGPGSEAPEEGARAAGQQRQALEDARRHGS